MPVKHYSIGPKGRPQAAKDVEEILGREKPKQRKRAKELSDV